MIAGIAFILIAVFVEMPKVIMITLCVFGALKIGYAILNADISSKD